MMGAIPSSTILPGDQLSGKPWRAASPHFRIIPSQVVKDHAGFSPARLVTFVYKYQMSVKSPNGGCESRCGAWALEPGRWRPLDHRHIRHRASFFVVGTLGR